MKPLNVFPRRFLSISFSVYFTVFSSLSLAAPKAAKAKKTVTTVKATKQVTLKTKSGAKKNEFPLIDKNSAVYKKYLHALKLAGPDENLFPDEVTKSSKDVQNMNSFIRYAAPFSLPLGSDPFSPSPIVPALPPITPLSPISPSLPNIGSGSLFPGGDFPNPGGVFNQNMMNTAPVSAEFSCPFFESNPHEAIFRALKSMRDSLSTINNDCLKTGETDQIYSNSDRIKNAVLYLKHFQTNPEQISTLNTKDIENSVASAMEGVNQITTRLKNNAILKPECGGYTSSLNRSIIAFNDVINNLAPVALITTALIPQISGTARAAIFGTTVVSQFVSSFWDSFKNNSIDMTKPENSRAVLQNTCQYLRVAQKINFLTYADKGTASGLSKTLNEKIKTFQTKYAADPKADPKATDPLNPAPPPLIPMLKYRYNSEKMFAEIETSLSIARADYRQYRYTIDKYRADMEKDKIDRNEEVCGVGARLASVGSIADNSSLLGMGGLGGFGGGFGGFGPMNSLVAFPLSIIANLDRVTEALQQANSNGFPGGFPGGFGFPVAPPPPVVVPPADPVPPTEKPTEKPTVGENEPIPDPFPLPPIPPPASNDQAVDQAESYFQDFKEYRNKVAASAEKAKQGSMEAVKLCADSTFKWFEKINILLDYTAGLANAERTGVAQELEKDPVYKEWALQYQKLKSEKQTISPLIQVLNAMSSENAQTTRTEMQSGLIQLRNTLFKRSSSLSESPVESWLAYNLKMHENMLGDFTKKYVSLRDGAFDLTETAKKTFLRRLNAKADEDIKNSQNLGNLNLKNIKTDTLVHYKACERINTALLSYNASKDFLNSSQFMCNMIFGIMSDTGPQIIKICQGSLNINQNKSEIEIRKAKLNKKNAGMKIDSYVENYSFNEMENFLKKAGQELKCPDPTSPLIL